jgi:hypothetical protein
MRQINTIVGLAFAFSTINCGPRETADMDTFNQSEVDPLEAGERDYIAGQACVYQTSNRQPKSTFPFDKSDKIELVSYDHRLDSYSNDELIKDGKFTVKNILQRETIRGSQRDSLFAILYNYKRIVDENDNFGSDCYDPHNSVLFYEKGKVIAFYEVCFFCRDTRQTKGVDFGQFCEEKNCMLQSFFKANKVDKGTYDEMCEWMDKRKQ